MSHTNLLFTTISDLVALSPRQGPGEEQTYQYIKSYLEKNNRSSIDQKYKTSIPLVEKVSLMVDSKSIDCRGVGLSSGMISSVDRIISSSFDYADDVFFPSNINFNPHNNDGISASLLYKNPAWAIHKKDVLKIMNAKKVKGELKVKKYSFTAHNILIGNIEKPKNIVFTHYDGLETGAVDNASGTAIVLAMVVHEPRLLQHTLFAVCGNEELSYEMPVYWGNGYRQFQKINSALLNNTKNIYLIDSVGFSKPSICTDIHRLNNAIPLKHLERYMDKLAYVCCPYEQMLPFYHSTSDTVERISATYLHQAYRLLRTQLA